MGSKQNKRSGSHSGGGGNVGGGGKRGKSPQGWEKGDIVRDVVVDPEEGKIPRKPGSRREVRAMKVEAGKERSPKQRPKPEVEATPLYLLFRSEEDRRLSDVVERIAAAAARKLNRKHPGLERLSVRVEDVNGPKGGQDKLCRVKAVWARRPSEVVTQSAATALPAVRGAFTRLDRLLSERNDRRVRARRRAS